MSGGDASTAKRDAERSKANLRSKTWATKDGQRWTDEDDLVIIDEWILVAAFERDEFAVSKRLERTVFACQRRAEYLREVLDVQGDKHPKRKEERPVVCPDCNTALPKSGQCDYCE